MDTPKFNRTVTFEQAKAQMAKKSYTDKKRDDSSRIEILLRNSATK